MRGRFWSLTDVRLEPRPMRRRLEFWLGGSAPAALRRVGRIADGWLASFVGPDEFAGMADAIRASAAEAGRSIDEDHYGATVFAAPSEDELPDAAPAPEPPARSRLATTTSRTARTSCVPSSSASARPARPSSSLFRSRRARAMAARDVHRGDRALRGGGVSVDVERTNELIRLFGEHQYADMRVERRESMRSVLFDFHRSARRSAGNASTSTRPPSCARSESGRRPRRSAPGCARWARAPTRSSRSSSCAATSAHARCGMLELGLSQGDPFPRRPRT